MTLGEGMRDTMVPNEIVAAFLLEPPGWTRLEPQSVSGDPTPGLEARLHDPLWLLTRQWQLGEFAAEDAGSPVAVHVATSTSPVTGWLAGDPAANPPVRPLPPAGLLESAIEREPTSTVSSGPSLRVRADAGAQLLEQLADAGVQVGKGSAVLAGLLADCPLSLPWTDPHDRTAPGLLAVLGGRVPDGEAAATQAGPGLAAAPPQPPPWLAAVPAADAQAALAALADWYGWYRGQVVPPPEPGAGSWIDERLEYRFGLVAGSQTFQAPAFGGGRADWYTVDAVPAAAGPPPGPPPAGPLTGSQTMLATPLRFAGMPADRYWQFEDGQVNLGALEVQPHDLARLLLVEFATVYGNDWLVVPVDVPLGSYTEVSAVTYSTTFGEELAVAHADDSGRTGRFRLFEVTVAGSAGDALPGLLVPPSVVGLLDGPAVEEVLYLRDEMANMAWAVERVVEGPSGEARSRRDEGYPPPFSPGTDPGAELDYLLENEVPGWWIPFVPVATGYRTLALHKGAMLHNDQPVEPLGVMLRPGEALVVRDEEIPRDGVRVRRVPTLTRGIDGSYSRWITRRVTIGKGEGASGLAFDSTVARKPPI
jgi:hypothetical protein